MAEEMTTQGAAIGESPEQQRYAIFVADIRAHSGLTREQAEQAANAVLCVLDQRLSGGEATRMASELPEPLQEKLRRCERHSGEHAEPFSANEFFRRVAEHLGRDEKDVEPIHRAVFWAARRQLSGEQERTVASQLPKDLQALWNTPEPAVLLEEAVPRERLVEAIRRAQLSPDKADRVVEAIMCTLSQRLTDSEAEAVEKELPARFSVLLERCARHERALLPFVDAHDFLKRVGAHFGISERDAEPLARMVFAAVRDELTGEEIELIANELPRDVRALWLAPPPDQYERLPL